MAHYCPDIDAPKSLIGGLCKRLSYQLCSNYSHRGLTHSIIFLATLMIIPGLGLGALSHVLLDLLTPKGVKLLYPNKNCYVMLGAPLKTGRHDLIISLIFITLIILC